MQEQQQILTIEQHFKKPNVRPICHQEMHQQAQESFILFKEQFLAIQKYFNNPDQSIRIFQKLKLILNYNQKYLQILQVKSDYKELQQQIQSFQLKKFIRYPKPEDQQIHDQVISLYELWQLKKSKFKAAASKDKTLDKLNKWLIQMEKQDQETSAQNKTQIKKENYQVKELRKMNSNDFVQKVQELQSQVSQYYEIKKLFNNQLQEELGNIRVYCRIRPFRHPNNMRESGKIQYDIIDSTLRIQKDKNQLKSKNITSDFTFVFQKIFNVDITQEELYQEIKDLIQNSVDGKNVCIFAYGQTGSGKTHTMKGGQGTSAGLIPRSLITVFQQVNNATFQGYTSKVDVSIIEIYNQKVFDLLDGHRQIQSKDAEFIQIQNAAQGEMMFDTAMKNRSTAFTQSNSESSRSHLLFTITSRFQKNEINRISSLVLIDLAGSQRINESKATGQRQKQAKFINKSLTQLGIIMRQIKQGKSPSFRGSKLNLALQPYLQGDGKAIMFVNVSLEVKDIDQTINSLRFAEGVKDCKIYSNKQLKGGQSDRSDSQQSRA